MADREKNDDMDINWSGIVIRLITTMIVVGLAAFFTPGFSINSLGALFVASIVIAIMDYVIIKFTGVNASPFGRGMVGFIVSAIILYATKFFVSGFNISMFGAIVGALVIGIIDAIIPGDEKSAL